MAWTSPRTWVANEVVTAALMNTHVRDNLSALSTHTHTGAAGDGDDVLSGIDSVTFDDIGEPVSSGQMRRSGNDLYYHDGTASRKITNHIHEPDTVQTEESLELETAHPTNFTAHSVLDGTYVTLTGTYQTLKTVSRAGETGRNVTFVISGAVAVIEAASPAATLTIGLFIDTVEKATSTSALSDGGASDWGADAVMHAEDGLDSTSHTIELKAKISAGSPKVFFAALHVTEVKVP